MGERRNWKGKEGKRMLNSQDTMKTATDVVWALAVVGLPMQERVFSSFPSGPVPLGLASHGTSVSQVALFWFSGFQSKIDPQTWLKRKNCSPCNTFFLEK